MERAHNDRVHKVKDHALKIYLKTIAANEREDRNLRRNLDTINGHQRKQFVRMQRLIGAAKAQHEKKLSRMQSIASYSDEGGLRDRKLAGNGMGTGNKTKTWRSTEKAVTSAREVPRYNVGLRKPNGILWRPASKFTDNLQTCDQNALGDYDKRLKCTTKLGRYKMEADELCKLTFPEEHMQDVESSIDFQQGCKQGDCENGSNEHSEYETLKDSVKYTETEVKNLKVSFIGKQRHDSKRRRNALLPDLDEDPNLAIARRRRRWKRQMLRRTQLQQQKSILEEKLNALSLVEIANDRTLPEINQETPKG